ncbi:MAG: lipopolysaccharide kinase [Legionellales bacterium]|nr:lipopolysaccharide kinase [Legionellales bacterium]|tara:strand:+ start:33041 stop:33856 length:816 start_codon:yes stop_codon:yes gene_type:complete
MTKDMINPDWQVILAHNGLKDFEALWHLPVKWVEAPNQRRGGFSGVAKVVLQHPAGGTAEVYLKRQYNHFHRTLCHPIKGELTLKREMKNILRCQKAGVPVITPVYFATRCTKDSHRGLLLTVALTDYQSLDQWMAQWRASQMPCRDTRHSLLEQLAKIVRTMHDHGLQHGCLHDYHIFLKLTEDDASFRLIDLEMLKWRPDRARLRDLHALNRHSEGWSTRDRLRFYKYYLGIDKLTPKDKGLWQQLERRYQRKLQQKQRKQRAYEANHR